MVIGSLVSLLVTLKGLPLTYNRDLQEDKEPVFDAIDTLLLVLPAVSGMVETMRVNVARLAAEAPVGFSLATDVAEALVRRGVPFREAHEAVGHLVVWCGANDCDLGEVSDDDLQKISPHLTPEIRSVLSVEGALRARTAHGSTAPDRVAEQLEAARHEISSHRAWAGEVGESD